MNNRLLRFGLVGIALLIISSTVLAQIAQDRNWFTVDGGGGTSRGGDFAVQGTIGQHDAGGTLSGGDFTLAGGFWGGGAELVPPVVGGVVPDTMPDNRDVTVTITGTDFVRTPRILLNDQQLADVTFNASTELSALVPAGLEPDIYDLTVINPGGRSDTLSRTLTILAAEPPQIAAVAPREVLNDRDTTLQITGANFVPRSDVFVGATRLADVAYVNENQLDAVVPAEFSPGQYDLRVTDPANRSDSLADAVTVVLPPPRITRVRPTQGRNDSYTTLVIDGSGFARGIRATMDANTRLPLLQFNDSSQIEVLVPARKDPGRYSITVTNRDGQSATRENAFEVTELQLPPLRVELVFEGWEVTQGIQNLLNDVPLVANKPTYVRVYGRSAGGTRDGRAPRVDALLRGSSNGVSLPGSPLSPMNSTQDLRPGQRFDRGNANDSWTFRLPESWYREGTIQLEVEIDPASVYDTLNRGNNSTTDTFVFNLRTEPCLVFVPIRTDQPAPTWHHPNFARTVDGAIILMPISDFVESTIASLDETFDTTDENEQVNILGQLEKLASHHTPAVPACSGDGAVTHYVGMLDPSANTTYTKDDGSTFTTGGLAYTPGNSLWIRLGSGNTLAHELGHNYGRQHVDCGGPDRTDGNYPYDPCMLDNRYSEPGAYFGFDVRSRTPLRPNTTADLMSYGHVRDRADGGPLTLWPSDYTWRAMYNRIGPSLATTGAAEVQSTAAVSDALVSVTGIITPDEQLGELGYAWKLPVNEMDPGAVQQWSNAAAPVYGTTSDNEEYHLRLLNSSGTVLDDRQIELPIVEAHGPGHSHDTDGFFSITVPAPAEQVARLELMQGSTVLAAMSPGLSEPSATITAPGGGETISDTLDLSWQASDPDASDNLRYIVQYSPDQGQSWQALIVDSPGVPGTALQNVTLDDLSWLAGSTEARLRVIASDGYNTAIAVSEPFRVTGRPPRAYIVDPFPGKTYPPGVAVTLSGEASDNEDTNLTGSALRWSLNGDEVGTGADVTLEGLAPGTYTTTLTAGDSDGMEATASASFTIEPLSIPSGAAPSGDLLCNDAAYEGAKPLQLAPYSDGQRAQAQLMRTETDLWICIDRLTRPGDDAPDRVGVWIDQDHSRDPQAQPDDYGFFVDSDGIPYMLQGDGQSGFTETITSTLRARIYDDGNSFYTELQIPLNSLPDLGSIIGLSLEHQVNGANAARYTWPYRAEHAQPATWATTVLDGVSPLYLPLIRR
jgi:hypothetical protein